jgi:CDP-diacylglycerol--glycerol-3-phosphate 3-phosphatidyltransferase
MDLAISLSLAGAAALLGVVYALRLALRGRSRHARVDAEGKSALVGKGLMEMLYWSISPWASWLARAGVSANAVTWASLVVGLAAGVSLGLGHFGLGALLATIACAGDAVDGFIARATGTSSDAGEVLDAAIDRYVELAFLAGVGVAFRESVPLLVLTMAAIGASFMVSYSTAKAEALHVEPPRGSMRRTERAIVLIAGAWLTPIAGAIREGWQVAPMLGALGLIAIAGNFSAAARFSAIRARVARRDEGDREAGAEPPRHAPRPEGTAARPAVR